MLVLKEELLLSVQHEASEDAHVDASLQQTAYVELFLDICGRFSKQLQLSVPSATRRTCCATAEKALEPRYRLKVDITGFLVQTVDVLLTQHLAQRLFLCEFGLHRVLFMWSGLAFDRKDRKLS